MTGIKENEAIKGIVGITEMHQEREYALMAKFFDDMFGAYSLKVKNVLEPKVIEEDYTGILLNESYNETDFTNMIESFKVGKIFHAKYAVRILKDSIEKFSKLPNVPVCHSKLDACVLVSCKY